VPLAHAQARRTLRLMLVFLVAAGVAAAVDRVRWLPLHLFLAGAVVLAISGVSIMLTVTWSAAPAPPGWAATGQRWAIALGAAGVAVGRRWSAEPLTATAGSLYLVGLVGLAALLVATAARGVERRFDPAVWGYVVAIVAGLAGVGMGIAAATGNGWAQVRSMHVTTNLLGLVGLSVAGTLPFFAATVVRAKMSPRATRVRLGIQIAWLAGALGAAVVGFAQEAPDLAMIGLLAYAMGVAAVYATVPRPTRRQLTWAGPRLVGLWAAGAWWILVLIATAADARAGRAVFAGRWLVVLVVATYGQVLGASVAYLFPMLRGGGHVRLGEAFAATRSWPGLVAVNMVGLSAAVGFPNQLTAAALAAWVADTAWRLGRIRAGTGPSPR
jgi:nitrite reductase (NO-forming)